MLHMKLKQQHIWKCQLLQSSATIVTAAFILGLDAWIIGLNKQNFWV